MTQAAILAASGSPGTTTGFKNRIINGAMTISQYNGTSSTTPGNNVYPIDRFIYKATQASKFTAQQVTTAPAGFTNSLKMTVASSVSVGSGDFFAIGQRIEGLNLYDIGFGTSACKSTSLSFWVQSSLTGTFGGALTNAAGDASYAFTYTISAANTWTQVSISVPPVTTGTWVTDNSNCLQVWFGLGCGSSYSGTAGSWLSGNNFSATGAVSVVGTGSATFLVTGIQLEVGTTATNFDFRSIGTELLLCQRYYEFGGSSGGAVQFSGTVTSGAAYYTTVYLKVTKRAIPTITTTNVNNANFPAVASTTFTDDTTDFRSQRTASGTGAGVFGDTFTASAEL
jgi:hypothetical protein